MITSRALVLAAAAACAGWAVQALAAEGLAFFGDDSMSFEPPRTASPAAGRPDRAAASQGRAPDTNRGSTATGVVTRKSGGVSGGPRLTGAGAGPVTGAKRAQPGPGAVVPPAGAPGAPGFEELRVLRVRDLSAEERSSARGHLQCTDPLVAELRVAGQVRALLSTAMGVPPDRLPQEVAWILGRTGRCFRRPEGPVAAALDRLDDAIRRSARGLERR